MPEVVAPIKYYKLVEKRHIWLSISTLLILIGFCLMGVRFLKNQPMLNLGLDFTGGMSMRIKFDALDADIKAAKIAKKDTRHIQVQFIEKVRQDLHAFKLNNSVIQATEDNEILIRIPSMSVDLRQKIVDQFKTNLGSLTLLEAYEVGPTIGTELKEKAFWLMFLCSIAIMLYIAWRFEFIFGVAALVALLHDALFVLSFASIFHLEIDTAFIAAILTILGYSINDTIVVYDRIRENIGNFGKKLDFSAIVNISTMQVMRRSLYSSFTVLLSVSALILFAGPTLKNFSWVLFAGIASGTYSSIFIAIPVLVMLTPKQDA